MNKNFGAIFLVAGTCIGSGMVALPMVLAKLGIIPSICLMIVTWLLMYYTSLINLELNLKAGRGLALGALGRLFSGRRAEAIGVVSLKLLSYSLLCVFLYGGSSILQKIIESKMGLSYSFETIASCYAIGVAAILILPIKWIDYVNRLLFICLFAVVLILIVGLSVSIHWSNLPLLSPQYREPSTWMALIPVVFTSFGFQVIFHTLTNYCNRDGRMLKQTFFWGSFIPLIVYILWTCSILSVVYQDQPQFYSQMVSEEVEVGQLIEVLSSIAKWPALQLLIWAISTFAIATSVVGVGVGLFDSIKAMLIKKTTSPYLPAIITILPAYLIVIFIPNAFIKVLGFAGMILAVIAVLLPAYLFFKIKKDTLYYKELSWTFLVYLSIGGAIFVILSEIYSMVGS